MIYQRLKKDLNKSAVKIWLRGKLSFKLLRSVNICIGSSTERNVNEMKKKNKTDDSNVSNMFVTSALTKNKSSIVRKDFDIL